MVCMKMNGKDSFGITEFKIICIAAAGSLTSNEVQPFYLEGAQVNVLCLNNNESPRFQGVPGWTNSSGDTVGVGDSLTFVATRELAGVYICSIPSATAIPSFVYEVVVHCK